MYTSLNKRKKKGCQIITHNYNHAISRENAGMLS